jgi:hypothetical protein
MSSKISAYWLYITLCGSTIFAIYYTMTVFSGFSLVPRHVINGKYCATAEGNILVYHFEEELPEFITRDRRSRVINAGNSSEK